jgi:fumarate hydratase class II
MQKNDDNKPSKSSEITDILYGTETAKALTNFTISELKMPRAFLWALATLKSACAQANQ